MNEYLKPGIMLGVSRNKFSHILFTTQAHRCDEPLFTKGLSDSPKTTRKMSGGPWTYSETSDAKFNAFSQTTAALPLAPVLGASACGPVL